MNAAIVGTGGYAYEILRRIRSLPEYYSLVGAVCLPGVNNTGVEECRRDGIAVYESVEQLLCGSQAEIDIVFVPTSIHTHFEIASKCLEHGCNVFIEKPPVATIHDYDELMRLARKKGKRVAVGFQYIYSNAVQRLKELLSEGNCGRIKRVRALGCWIRYDWYYRQVPWLGRLAIDGKWVLDGSINNPLAHMLSAAIYLASSSREKMAHPESVRAELYSGHKIEGEDTASLRIFTDEGVEVISNTTLCPEVERDVEIIVECEKAELRYINFERAVILWDNGLKEEIADDMDHRKFMLEKIARDIKFDKTFDADLNVCRPFTLTVNSAYESSGKVHSIGNHHIREIGSGKDLQTIIKGVDDAIEKAHQNGLLLSETSVTWAVDTETFETEGYVRFPLSGELRNIMSNEEVMQGCR